VRELSSVFVFSPINTLNWNVLFMERHYHNSLMIMNVIYGYILSNTTIIVFQLVFISSYMFRSVYNGHLQALAREGVLRIV
jgi:hypothetical protein